MTKKFISLREVGRQLNIPPSTVVYYKDRFASYIPSSGGEGRRKRYPYEVLEIFRRIREMFNNNWSTEQIEKELALKYGSMLDAVESADSSGVAESSGPHVQEFMRNMGGVLEKMTDLLENQSLFKSEISSLRDELVSLKQERKNSEKRYGESVAAMEKELRELRQAKMDLENMLRNESSQSNPQFPVCPPEEFLCRPLVIRTSQGEYLGVLGRGVNSHFGLKDFIALMDRHVTAGKTVDMQWDRRNGHWVLRVQAVNALDSTERSIVLVVQKTVTPSRNVVTEIVRLNVDGQDAPDALLLSLFKQIKEHFD